MVSIGGHPNAMVVRWPAARASRTRTHSHHRHFLVRPGLSKLCRPWRQGLAEHRGRRLPAGVPNRRGRHERLRCAAHAHSRLHADTDLLRPPSAVDSYEFNTMKDSLTEAQLSGKAVGGPEMVEFKPMFHEWATVQPGMITLARKKRTAVFRQYVAAETAVPVIACAAGTPTRLQPRLRARIKLTSVQTPPTSQPLCACDRSHEG